MFYLLPLPGKTLIWLHFQNFHFRLHSAGFSSSNGPSLMTSIPYQPYYDRWIISPLHIFPHLCHLFTHFFSEASRHTSANLSFSSSSISAACWRLARLVYFTFSNLVYTLSYISDICQHASHLVSATVLDWLFLLSAKSSSIKCVFCRPSSRSASVISSNMSNCSWLVLMER